MSFEVAEIGALVHGMTESSFDVAEIGAMIHGMTVNSFDVAEIGALLHNSKKTGGAPAGVSGERVRARSKSMRSLRNNRKSARAGGD